MLTARELRKGWWMEERATIPCGVMKDGLLVIFKMEDAAEAMNKKYPFKDYRGERHWFFNDTFDRECAEQDGDRILANPSVLYELFMGRE